MGLEDVLDREALGSNVVEDLLQMSRAVGSGSVIFSEHLRCSCGMIAHELECAMDGIEDRDRIDDGGLLGVGTVDDILSSVRVRLMEQLDDSSSHDDGGVRVREWV